MKRNEIIEILIEDRIWDWVYAGNSEGLEEVLYAGFTGFKDYSDKELEQSINDIDKETLKEIMKMLKDKLKQNNS